MEAVKPAFANRAIVASVRFRSSSLRLPVTKPPRLSRRTPTRVSFCPRRPCLVSKCKRLKSRCATRVMPGGPFHCSQVNRTGKSAIVSEAIASLSSLEGGELGAAAFADDAA